MKSIFILESKVILQKCMDHMSRLSTVSLDAGIHQELLTLADNLCEPALMVGLPAVFDAGRAFRQALFALPRDQIVPKASLDQLRHQCHVMQSILVAESSGSTLSVQDILAHDLKSPLAIIKTTAENLLASPRADDTAPLQRILRQANKGLQLLAHWLHDDSSQGKGQERQRLTVESFLKECCDSLVALALPKKIRISYRVEAALTVQAHELYLSQILQNLLSNAIKFSKDGGAIEVHVKRARLPGSEMAAVLFQVIDQGRGIDEQMMPYIFLQRTQTEARDRQQGSGLGLAICKSLCEWHGGTIWAQSRPGQGSIFSFVIPDG